ncbi:MAG TPA: nuclear transport factor 2 family protein [Thermoleophilaceae bacterium]|jgi:ketosteroid isomerase-like protein|nr:nuclear transport factor 2 family protein [Thermoleophilaceae bacterium]
MSGEVNLVRRYYEIVGDLASTPDDLRAVLHPDVQIHEYPNAISPSGSVRDRDEAVAAFAAGKKLLSEQSFDVHEAFSSGDRVAVRATWRGTLANEAGGIPAGRELVAQIAALLTVKDGKIRRHETFDCYEPF